MNSSIGFPMPKSIVVDEATETPTYAKFTAQPFQRGYGHTLGNALRRVLLSSLDGAAICSVRIDDAKHEFDSLENVVEDVTEIVLNLKCVKLNLYAAGPKTLEITKDKAGPVTAGDIVCDSTVEVLNPEQVICTLDKIKNSMPSSKSSPDAAIFLPKKAPSPGLSVLFPLTAFSAL